MSNAEFNASCRARKLIARMVLAQSLARAEVQVDSCVALLFGASTLQRYTALHLDPTDDQVHAVGGYLSLTPWWMPNSMSTAWAHTTSHLEPHPYPWRGQLGC